MSDDDCPVCYEKTTLVSLPCEHRICSLCKDRLRQKTCPMCRAPLPSYMDTLIPSEELNVSPVVRPPHYRRRRRRRRRRWDDRVRRTPVPRPSRRPRTWSNDSERQKKNARW